jgi:hypothetical protein
MWCHDPVLGAITADTWSSAVGPVELRPSTSRLSLVTASPTRIHSLTTSSSYLVAFTVIDGLKWDYNFHNENGVRNFLMPNKDCFWYVRYLRHGSRYLAP